jgi:predicted dehydrogenase
MSYDQESSLKPIGLGIIGAGLAVRYLHWPAFKELPGRFKIKAVCDVVPQQRQEVVEMAAQLHQEQYGTSTTEEIAQDNDYRALLVRPEVEAVLIALPIHLNAQVMLDSALAGKHILCEKPLASNLTQARKLVATLNDIAAKRNLVIEIAENYHYRPELNEAYKWAFEEKAIGEVTLIMGHVGFWLDPSKGFASTPWRMDNQYRGGLLLDGGIHYTTLMRKLGGEIEQVQAFTKKMHPAMKADDTLSLNLRFRNGALGYLLYSGGIAAPNWDLTEAQIYGSNGTIKIGRYFARLLVPDTQASNPSRSLIEQRVFEPAKGGYYLEVLNFYEGVRCGQAIIANLDEGLRDFELIMAALDSAEESRVILM